MKSGPLIVQFGAGAIGRGFMGQLWTQGGHPVLFVDVNAPLVDALNAKGSYPLRVTGQDTLIEVRPVQACLIRDAKNITAALVGCDFCVQCGGRGAVSGPCAAFGAKGIAARRSKYRRDAAPLNIICCENQKNAAQILRSAKPKSTCQTMPVCATILKNVSASWTRASGAWFRRPRPNF